MNGTSAKWVIIIIDLADPFARLSLIRVLVSEKCREPRELCTAICPSGGGG